MYCISSLDLALVGYPPPLMLPLHPHSAPLLMPSLHHYSSQQLHSHGQLQPQERQKADSSPWLISWHGRVSYVAIACRNWCLNFVISAELRSKTLKMQYNFTIAIKRLLRTVSTLMQAYHTERSCEDCSDFCVQRLVRVVCNIGRSASLNFRYDLTIADRS